MEQKTSKSSTKAKSKYNKKNYSRTPISFKHAEMEVLRQNRVYRDKKEKSEQEVSKKQKRQVNPCFFYSKQAVIRPRGQNAYQRDRGLQEQTKNSI